MVNTTLALETTKFLEKEVEYMPWETARRSLDYYFLMFDRSVVYGPMQVCNEFQHLLCFFNELNPMLILKMQQSK